MTLRLLISLSLLLLAWQDAGAQLAPADDFFNSGAQFYISNNIPQALESTETGLKQYPNDEKLKKLEALLKQQQQQQSQQNQQQQNQSQQQKSNGQQNQQKQNQQSSAKNSQDRQKQDEQKQNQSDQQKAEQQKQQEQQQTSAQKKEGDKQEQQNAEGQPVQPGQMTPEEAKRLLDAQKGDEQVLQMKPQGKPEDQNRPIKDW
jgi:Ca-activated chloride channel family protein